MSVQLICTNVILIHRTIVCTCTCVFTKSQLRSFLAWRQIRTQQLSYLRRLFFEIDVDSDHHQTVIDVRCPLEKRLCNAMEPKTSKLWPQPSKSWTDWKHLWRFGLPDSSSAFWSVSKSEHVQKRSIEEDKDSSFRLPRSYAMQEERCR